MFPYYNTDVTIELRKIVDSGVDIWDFEYPCFYAGEEKKKFEQKILDHYAFRQIGQETVGRWLHYFRTRMREIMPYYNQLYKSVEIINAKEDPFESYNLTEEYTREHSDSGSSTASGSATSETENTEKVSDLTAGLKTRAHSDTPQGSIGGVVTLDYLTDYTKEDDDLSRTVNGTTTEAGSSETSATQSSEGSGNEHYTLTRRGNIGVATLGEEMQKYRAALLNVDMMVINELKDLFIQVY